MWSQISEACTSTPLYHHATELVTYRPQRSSRYLQAPRMPPPARRGYSERRGLRAVLGVILGALLGFLLAQQLRAVLLGREGGNATSCSSRAGSNPTSSENVNRMVLAGLESASVHNSSRALLFVGVMTAQKYLDTRAKAVYETWGRELPGRIAFFSSANSETDAKIPLVRLQGVDDSYPPQKKSFLMLKYMYENFGDKFEWFMRADDDVYVRPDRLETLLRSVDSRKPQFIGQAGRGVQEEFGLLSLEYDENFCMGGPGVLMSRATLALVAPHVAYCLKNLYSTHEDVELGRCVRRFAGIPCTWSYEMQTILYHNSSGSEAFAGILKHKEVHRAITLHPVKQHAHLYRVHNYMRALRTSDLLQRSLLLRRDVAAAREALEGPRPPPTLATEIAEHILGRWPNLHKYRAHRDQDVLSWEFFSRALYSATNANPRRRIEAPLREALDDVVREVMEMTNAYSRQRGRVLDFKEVLYGYHRLNPLAGQELVLDLQLLFRKYRGRKMTIPVRRHCYLQRSFLPLEYKEVDDPSLTSRSNFQTPLLGLSELPMHLLGPAAALARPPVLSSRRNPALDKVVTFLIPLAGRLTTFKRFAALYEEVCLLGGQATALVLVLFPSDDVAETVQVVQGMQQRYPLATIDVLPAFVPFARGLALQLGAAHVQSRSNDTILFFIDVDMVFTSAALQRVRLNTLRGRQAYFPIVFSEFDPGVVYANSSLSPDHFRISDDTGYWRNYGFGIAAAYPEDLITAGGFDTGIKGWGKEDVDLYNKFVKSNVTVFRAADPGLVHVFHIVECDSSLDVAQLVMCYGTMANTYGGVVQLARVIQREPAILQLAKDNKKDNNS